MWGWGKKTEWGLDLLYSKLTGPPDGHPAALHIFRLARIPVSRFPADVVKSGYRQITR
jgi:hypothetical protein